MYSYIKGLAVKKEENILIVENNGIGYEIFASNYTLDSIVTMPSEVKIYTHYHVREDQSILYGFSTKEEKNVFNKLIKVSGVGAKMAITILSGIKYSDLTMSIHNSDVTMLSKIKGVGKKTSERIVLELKGGLDDLSLSSYDNSLGGTNGSTKSEAAEALISLGVTYIDANRLVKKVMQEGDTVEMIIEKALRNFRG